ncbi:MAG: hypothetical protein WBD40_16245 [Tepidisphaeraceae bacterium]
MVIIAPPLQPPRRRSRSKRRTTQPMPPVALTLVAASYDKDLSCVDLAFDRAIDIGAMDVTSVAVDDDTFRGLRLAGFETPVLLNPTTVRVSLNEVGGAMQPGVHLTTGAGNGIVAVDDGGTWAGATDLLLPFP